MLRLLDPHGGCKGYAARPFVIMFSKDKYYKATEKGAEVKGWAVYAHIKDEGKYRVSEPVPESQIDSLLESWQDWFDKSPGRETHES